MEKRIPDINDEVSRQLLRQLKILNFWISLFGTIIVVLLIALGVLAYKSVMFMRDTQQQVMTLQTQAKEALDVKSDVCKNSFVSGTSYCKD